jgi:hypothetical protein
MRRRVAGGSVSPFERNGAAPLVQPLSANAAQVGDDERSVPDLGKSLARRLASIAASVARPLVGVSWTNEAISLFHIRLRVDMIWFLSIILSRISAPRSRWNLRGNWLFWADVGWSR